MTPPGTVAGTRPPRGTTTRAPLPVATGAEPLRGRARPDDSVGPLGRGWLEREWARGAGAGAGGGAGWAEPPEDEPPDDDEPDELPPRRDACAQEAAGIASPNATTKAPAT
jgi:hypothetical protein